MDYRMYERLEERLRKAMQMKHIEDIQFLLSKKAFRMLGEEMDELLQQLGSEKLEELENSLHRRNIRVQSKEAQLKHEVGSGEICRVSRFLDREHDYFSRHVKASSIASIAIHAIRATTTPKYAIIELLFKWACEVNYQDSAVALPLLYDVLTSTPASQTKDKMLSSSTRLCGPSAFFQLAARSGDVAMVKYILSKSSTSVDVDDVYEGDVHKATALLRAAHHGRAAVVTTLLEMGADRCTAYRDKDGRTALHLAASKGHAAIVELLLKHRYSQQQQHLQPAATVAAPSALSSSGNNVPTDLDDGSVPAAHRRRRSRSDASSAGRYQNQADAFNVDVVDRWGMSALHLAACGGHSEVVKALLDAGADPFARAPEEPPDFSLYLNTYLVLDREKKLGMKEQTKKIDVVVTASPLLQTHPQNHWFRLDPIMSVYWQPGGFTALHFAVAYGRDERTITYLINYKRKVEADPERYVDMDWDLVHMKDSNGLTALDWAEALRTSVAGDVEEEEEEEEEKKKKKKKKKVGWYNCILKFAVEKSAYVHMGDVLIGDEAHAYLQVVERTALKKKEVEWCDRIGWALRNGKFEMAETLARLAIKKLCPLSSSAVQHLKWAASGPGQELKQKWKYDQATRKYLEAERGWALKVERVMMAMIKSAPVVMDAAELQGFMVWALRKGMADLAIELSKHKDCELVEPLRGGAEGLAPLDAATAWQTEKWEIGPVLHAMESRKDVKESVNVTRELFVSYLNALLVAAVLIGTLAFSAILQPPAGLKSSLQGHNNVSHDNNNGNVPSDSQLSTHLNNSGGRLSKTMQLATAVVATIVSSSPAAEGGNDARDQNSERVHGLAHIFIWSMHISFFFSMMSTLACITGAIPPGKGQLAHSQRRIQNCINLATVSLVLAVVAITFSFSSAILELAEETGKERRDLKVFAIVVGCSGLLILLWIMVRIAKAWEPVTEIVMQAKRRFPNESKGYRCWRRLSLFGIALLVLFLEWIYPYTLIDHVTDKRKVQGNCIRAARKYLGGSSNAAILYKSLRTIGVHFAEEESDDD